ncbi:MAG: class I SAM-dependent rRNA methyltransferase [Alphaproteobacteria bacterium]
MKTIRLKPAKERALDRRHPWVFSGAIAKGGGDPGETVRVEADDGRFLAWGAFSPSSQIRVRAWSFDEGERIDPAFFARRIARALAYRARLAIPSDAFRLVHGEADGLPGLIVDRYADTLVVQFLSAGAERWREGVVRALADATGAERIFERSDASVRKLEGLEPRSGWVLGSEPTEVAIIEHGWRFAVDVAEGHKTGHYLDQRDNRAVFRDWVRHGGIRTVLNGHAYTGGFAVAALAGGASHVTSVDSSKPALEQARRHVALNGFADTAVEFVAADVNASLRGYLAEGRTFDAIVLDPPKFAASAAQVDRAARAYKDLNRIALKVLAPGGVLMTFSCSGAVSADLFHKIVASAGTDASVDGYIARRLEAAPDHPTTLAFPEGEYLKGLVVVRC